MKSITVAAMAFLAQGLGLETFEHLHRELRPPADEVWRTIPWETDLLGAQARAAREGKPLFIWAMDGHPLGCT